MIDRKWLITSLLRCSECQLLYRIPTTTPSENERIYETMYAEGFTTRLPDSTALAKYIATDFNGSPNDYAVYIDVLRALGIGKGARIYDFGCSWGYGAYQLSRAGFEVEGFEISDSRSHFAANKLGIRLRNPASYLPESIDVFFSAHVLEHVPQLQKVLSRADTILRPGGWFVAFTPNGSLERRRRDPRRWHHAWGFVHPQLLDREWINAKARHVKVLADTNPYDVEGIRQGSVAPKWDGSELFFAYQKGA